MTDVDSDQWESPNQYAASLKRDDKEEKMSYQVDEDHFVLKEATLLP